jgi:hypothetical protein
MEDAGRVIEAVGLSLSGGGVRSAAVSLGVLQALNHHGALRNIDYLSSVSGGGYMASALTATMTKAGGDFVFGNKPATGNAPRAAEISDTAAVGHIRNYSNYLIPHGFRDVLTGVAIVVRGLVANLGTVLPFLLFAAALAIWSNPDRQSLTKPDVFGISLEEYLPVENFGLTLVASLVGLILFFIWALYRSVLLPDHFSEFHTRLPRWAAGFLIFLAFVFFCELQPFLIEGMFKISDARPDLESGIVLALITSWIKTFAALLAPIGTVVLLFRQQLADMLKTSANSSFGARGRALFAQVLIWLAAAALPFFIWVAFLYLSYWGIINSPHNPDAVAACPERTISTTVKIEGQGLNYSTEMKGKIQPAAGEPCPGSASTAKKVDETSHTPPWLLTTANTTAAYTGANWLNRLRIGHGIERPMAWFYFVLGVGLFVVAWPLKPNANSLHRLYRDRLSKAFLFDPTLKPQSKPATDEASVDQGRDFAELDTFKLSDLSAASAPYHLVNAALNIQGSDYANRRGRNADFFVFSKKWIGSEATGYAATDEFEKAAPEIDLATAMAISGAAASSNMGANSIRPLAPTLAILNVRLGYWMKNPAFFSGSGAVAQDGEKKDGSIKHRSSAFLWSEITGRLYENAREIYLTDGGHIENLGIYELLRRRCRVIVAVDAEADPSMHFPSLITLQRYARIDLGIRINLPWQPIQKSTLALTQRSKDPQAPKSARGPHIAIGTIDYGGGNTGYLVYLKSSLTGDENDYVRDYARRYDRFPHETTGDQFFSEEQFEVYRALGFHIAHGLLSGQDCIEVAGAKEGSVCTWADGGNPVVAAVREALIGKAPDNKTASASRQGVALRSP